MGLGLANMMPVLFAAAAPVEGIHAAEGLAHVAGLAYFGLLLGPVIIGGVAQVTACRSAIRGRDMFGGDRVRRAEGIASFEDLTETGAASRSTARGSVRNVQPYVTLHGLAARSRSATHQCLRHSSMTLSGVAVL